MHKQPKIVRERPDAARWEVREAIADYLPLPIEVVRPHAFGENEAAAIEALLKSWSSEHPEAEPERIRILD